MMFGSQSVDGLGEVPDGMKFDVEELPVPN